MTRAFLAFAGTALLVPTLAQAQQGQANAESYRFRVEYRWFSSTLEGDAAKGTGGVPGTEFDLKEDLGFVDDRTWELRGAIRVGARFKLRGGYTALDWAGESTLTSRIRFDDTSFNSGEATASTLKGGFYGGDLEFDFVNKPQGFLGVTGGVRVPDVDFVISSPNTGKRELGTFRPVAPVIGLIGRVYMGRVSLEGSGATFVEVSGVKATELEIGARIHISDRLAISGAYRYVSFKATSAGELPDFADVRAAGWTYGIELGL